MLTRNIQGRTFSSQSKFNYTLKSDARAFQTLASEKRSSQPNYELKLVRFTYKCVSWYLLIITKQFATALAEDAGDSIIIMNPTLNPGKTSSKM